MNSLRQVVLGILAALLSTAIILGSLSLAMTEGSRQVAFAPTFTAGPTLPPGVPSPTPAPLASLSPTPSCPIPPGWVVITIQPGDTFESLADAYGASATELANSNCLPSANVTLLPGNRFSVPGLPVNTVSEATATLTGTPTETLFPTNTPIPCGHPGGWIIYIVQKGDTLYHIATLFRTTVAELLYANCMDNVNIYTGQQLWVPNNPTITPEVSRTPTPTRTPTSVATPTPTLPSAETATPTAAPSDTPTATDTEIPPIPSETPTPPPPSPTTPVVIAPPPPTLSATQAPPV